MPSLRKPLPEAEGPVKAWVRSTGLFGNRSYLGAPDIPVYPLVISFRVGGGPLAGPVPIDEPLMQLDVCGDPEREGKDRYDLGALATALAEEIESIPSGTVMMPGVVCVGASVESGPLWLPTLDNAGRYTITANFGLRVASLV